MTVWIRLAQTHPLLSVTALHLPTSTGSVLVFLPLLSSCLELLPYCTD